MMFITYIIKIGYNCDTRNIVKTNFIWRKSYEEKNDFTVVGSICNCYRMW